MLSIENKGGPSTELRSRKSKIVEVNCVPRRGKVPARTWTPDPVYNSVLVTRLINKVTVSYTHLDVYKRQPYV